MKFTPKEHDAIDTCLVHEMVRLKKVKGHHEYFGVTEKSKAIGEHIQLLESVRDKFIKERQS